jgi:signal transduction histidine kinase
MNAWAKTLAVPLLLLVWGAFAGWQYHGFRHERALIEESLHQQSHSVMNALIGGASSHRRLGFFFQEQLQGMLDELASSHDVLAAAVAAKDGTISISAGASELLKLETGMKPGGYWDTAGFRLVEPFHIVPTNPDGAGGSGRGAGRGQGQRSRMWQKEDESPFSQGGDYVAVLLVDRARSDALIRRAAQSHGLVAAGGALVLTLIALAWRASVKMEAAAGQAQLLETEAKHLRDLSQAAAGLAHETRNPLGLIRGWTQRLAQADGDGEQHREHARAVLEECDRVTARINQFLAFAKPRTAAPQPVALDQLVNELGILLQPDLDAKHVTLEPNLFPDCVVVQADRELLRQALFNLLQNAIHFSPAGGVVSVASAPGKHGTCQITVSDQGPGVVSGQVDSLFTPYFTTRSDGTGLGLAIVQQVANLHGWQVSYQPRVGGGAVFSLENVHG